MLQNHVGYIGDGITKSFDIAVPKNLALKH